MIGPSTRHTWWMDRSSDEVIADWLHRRVTPVTNWADRHPVALDVLSALVIAVASFIGIVIQGRLRHPDVVFFCFALPAPLLVRHRDPQLSFGLIALVALGQWLVSTPQLADGAVLVAMFWLMLDGEVTEMAIAAAVVEAGAVMAALRWSPRQPEKVWVGITGLGVAAGVLGLAIRQRRAVVAATWERAARLEFERDQEGRLAAAAERARIAREMHDIVSHNLTVMIGLADGASYALGASPTRRCRRWSGSRRPAARRSARCAACSACSATSRWPAPRAPTNPSPVSTGSMTCSAGWRRPGSRSRSRSTATRTRCPAACSSRSSASPRRRSRTRSSTPDARRPRGSCCAASRIACRSRPPTPAPGPPPQRADRPPPPRRADRPPPRRTDRPPTLPRCPRVAAACAACANGPPPTGARSRPAPGPRAAGGSRSRSPPIMRPCPAPRRCDDDERAARR